MDAILKIEAALAEFDGAPSWHVSQPSDSMHAVRNQRGGIVADVGYSGDEKFDETICRYIAACNPAAIREVLQTLASKEAELVRLQSVAERFSAAMDYLLNHGLGIDLDETSISFAADGQEFANVTLGELKREFDTALTQPTE